MPDIRKKIAIQSRLIDTSALAQSYEVFEYELNDIVKSLAQKDQLISGMVLEYLGEQTESLIAAIRKANAQPWIPIALISDTPQPHHAIGCNVFSRDQTPQISQFLGKHTRPKVLIIEDEEHLQDILQQALSKTYDVTLASDGNTGFELANSGDYQLIVTDHNLPGMNGATIIENLNERGNSAPIILMTAFNEKELELASLSLGASEYLPKPVSIKVLRKSIIDVLLTHQKVAQYKNENEQKDTESWDAWHNSIKEKLS